MQGTRLVAVTSSRTRKRSGADRGVRQEPTSVPVRSKRADNGHDQVATARSVWPSCREASREGPAS